MPTKFDGKDFNLFLGGDAIYASSEISIDMTSERLDGSSRESGNFEDAIGGDFDATITATSMFTDESVSGKETGVDLLASQIAGDVLTATFRRSDPTNNDIDRYYVCDVLISSATFPFADNETVITNVTFQVTGGIEVETEGS